MDTCHLHKSARNYSWCGDCYHPECPIMNYGNWLCRDNSHSVCTKVFIAAGGNCNHQECPMMIVTCESSDIDCDKWHCRDNSHLVAWCAAGGRTQRTWLLLQTTSWGQAYRQPTRCPWSRRSDRLQSTQLTHFIHSVGIRCTLRPLLVMLHSHVNSTM